MEPTDAGKNNPLPLKILVATLTCKRPRMLADLLRSWKSLVLPPCCEVFFAVIENDCAPVSAHVVEDFSAQMSRPAAYRLEQRAGIPFARNAAVDLAVELEMDLLAFVDDDEVVDAMWLAELVATHRETDAVLIGGPVSASGPGTPLSPWKTRMLEGIKARCERNAKRNAVKSAKGQANRIAIVTNNWLAHISLFTVHELRFSEVHGVSGGSDTSFDRAVTQKGLPKAWAPAAQVVETIPASRLSFRYQFRRSRDQSIVSTRRKKQSGSLKAVVSLVPLILLRLIGAVLFLSSIPLNGGQALVGAARSLGWVYGRILGLFGFESRLYDKITGS
jgi:succinoglycan biosynthesis protein ExoM